MDATLSPAPSFPLLASAALALRDLRLAAYALGLERGEGTGREAPGLQDWSWLAGKGVEPALPEVAGDFEQGMSEGATLAEREEEQAEPPARPGRPPTAEEEAIALAI